ncbi:MAG: dihydropteroate synthase [Treponema sp.]
MEELIFSCNEKIIKNGDKTILAGILNVTPDSFSDGGKYFNANDALTQAKKMISEGATILDIGGESTRPGSEAITEEEEIKRIIPVIHAIRKEDKDVIISVDTWRANVAKASIEEGADIINDITGLLGDEKMSQVIANSKCGVVAMFNPVIARPYHEGSRVFRTFGYEKPFSDEKLDYFASLSIIELMKAYFEKTFEICEKAGIEKNRIMLDPGIGFGLTMKENLELIHNVELIHQIGYLSFVGVSRKRFIVSILQTAGFNASLSTEEGLSVADYASSFLSAIAAYSGVNVLRVHNVSKHLQAILIGDGVRMSNLAKDVNFSQYKSSK